MKIPSQDFLNLQQKLKIGSIPLKWSTLTRVISLIQEKADFHLNNDKIRSAWTTLSLQFEKIKSLGVTANLEEYESRKLKVFNLLNFFQLVFGIVLPITAILSRHRISPLGWVAACMPALLSVLVLYLNQRRNYEVSTLCYFILYPVITSIVYLSGMNLGIELFFILYGILAVFFIQDIGHMAFTITLSMISYFILTVVWRDYQFQLEVNGTLFLFNHLIAIVFIFFGLFLIKKENSNYQLSILNHNRVLHEKNIEIENQKREINENVVLLHKQATELRELNALKNKLFSVIAHDLKSPMYALRNMFMNVVKYDLPAEEVKAIIPEVMHDLNFTTSLMENLLQWAKCQMQSLEVTLEDVDVSEISEEVVQLLSSQAKQKKVRLVNKIKEEVFVHAQQDMIRLIIRNLVSNAIKFTPKNGTVTISVKEAGEKFEVSIHDTGIGISKEATLKICTDDYYSTNGTAAEKGTGLGLMLCREFLAKNDSSLHISSVEGKGSTFSFLLNKYVAKGNK